MDQLAHISRPGFYALRHRDGWWMGNDQGVLCWADRKTAQAALTIVWQMDGAEPVSSRSRSLRTRIR